MVLNKDLNDHKSIDQLDKNIVSSCLNSVKIMKQLLSSDEYIQFTPIFPFIQKGSQFCPALNCKKLAKLTCNRCKKARYCSKNCQVQDWKEHSRTCKNND